MTTLEALKLNRRLAGPRSGRPSTFSLRAATAEWKPRFVATPVFPRHSAGPGPEGADPRMGSDVAVKVVPWTFGADWP